MVPSWGSEATTRPSCMRSSTRSSGIAAPMASHSPWGRRRYQGNRLPIMLLSVFPFRSQMCPYLWCARSCFPCLGLPCLACLPCLDFSGDGDLLVDHGLMAILGNVDRHAPTQCQRCEVRLPDGQTGYAPEQWLASRALAIQCEEHHTCCSAC